VIKGLEALGNPDAEAIAAYMRVDLTAREES
jgi:hypothetical protein